MIYNLPEKLSLVILNLAYSEVQESSILLCSQHNNICIDEDESSDPLIPLFNKGIVSVMLIMIFTTSFKSSMTYKLFWATGR